MQNSKLPDGPSFGISGFKNIGKNPSEAVRPPTDSNPVSQVPEEFEDEILDELLTNSDQGESAVKSSDSTAYEIPVVNPVEIPTENTPRESLQTNGRKIAIYFLKFYGSGNKSHSRLAKVERESENGDLNSVISMLKMGPTAHEKKNGILNAIPSHLEFNPETHIENGILHLYLDSGFADGAGPDLLRDRIDQLTYTLMDNFGIRGIRLYIDDQAVSSLGGVGIPIPNLLVKQPRQVMTF